jgi:hypothetical protein
MTGRLAPIFADPRALRASCAVCGSEDLAMDEVLERGRWLLGECGRCRHRWTVGPLADVAPAPAIWRVPAPDRAEDAVAA